MKYKGVFPAFYACYDRDGNVSKERTKALAEYLMEKEVNGLYVCGSSGECIYQNVEERKTILESVMEVCKGKLTVIAHIAAPSTRDSIELAKHAERLGVDAIAAIPPIYFRLPESSIYHYWMDMVEATNLDFIIYNIPQTTGYNLSVSLFERMIAHPRVIGVKNSSMPVLDIEQFKAHGGKDCVIFNGPDEQFVAGRLMGADAGIGGTYGAMPELFLKANECIEKSDVKTAREIQTAINDIIMSMCSVKGNLYAVIKEILRLNGLDIGSVRAPLEEVEHLEQDKVKAIWEKIRTAIAQFC